KVWKELEAAGVTRIDRAGVPFDPNVHEAVTTQPAAKPEDDHTVGPVVQPGYKMRDILLRPARVVVLTRQGKYWPHSATIASCEELLKQLARAKSIRRFAGWR